MQELAAMLLFAGVVLLCAALVGVIVTLMRGGR